LKEEVIDFSLCWTGFGSGFGNVLVDTRQTLVRDITCRIELKTPL